MAGRIPSSPTATLAEQHVRPAQTPVFSVSNPRGGSSPVLYRSFYDYVPAIMQDGLYRMWWCGGYQGDYIYYSQSSSLSGPWSTPQQVLTPTFGATFDGGHVCDPSVIRVNGVYYMYYGGNTEPTGYTKIGVATSTNGINWTRANGGNPIISSAGYPHAFPNPYGAGQPSAMYVDGFFYLAYTDTMGQASNTYNGAGIYVLRSQDPLFQSGVQVLVNNGTYSKKNPNDPNETPNQNGTFVSRTSLNATL